MANVNKIIGNEYEKKFTEYLQRNGYWCHIFSYNTNGQPCDVVAIKNDAAYLIDVKHCEENRFYFKNIQPNQITCFEYNLQCGNKNTGFAIWFENLRRWYILPYLRLKQCMAKEMVSIHWVNLDELNEVL